MSWKSCNHCQRLHALPPATPACDLSAYLSPAQHSCMSRPAEDILRWCCKLPYPCSFEATNVQGCADHTVARDLRSKGISAQCLCEHKRLMTRPMPAILLLKAVLSQHICNSCALACPTALGELSRRCAKIPYVETLPCGIRLQACRTQTNSRDISEE